MELIDKSALVAEIEKYISNYKGILNKLDKSSDKRLDSTLMLESKIDVLQHILSFLNTLEEKEVDLKKEVDSQMDLLCNLLCYMDELSNGDSEGVYPLPINVKEDLQRFAKYFFELGLKAQKGE